MLSVLVEAFISRPHRRIVQLWLVAVVLLSSFVLVVRLAGTNELAAEGTIAVDGPGLFMMGSILLIAMVSALLIAERNVDPAGDAFAPWPRRHCPAVTTSGPSPSAGGCRRRCGRCSCSASAE